MDSVILTVLVTAAVTASLIAVLLGQEGRKAILRTLGRPFGWWQPPPPPVEVALPVAPPPKPSEPEIRYGNIPAILQEQEEEPDLSEVYVFPEKASSALRYADFNTRLIVVANSSDGTRRVHAVRVSDEPARYRGSPTFIAHLIKAQLRPAYPTIFDPDGIFALNSAMLEREPFLSNAIVDAYLGIPAERRPVVVSVIPPNKEGGKQLVFCRYGFEDFRLQLDFLNPNWPTSLRLVLSAFLGTPLEWSNFSHARLRHLATIADREMANTASLLAADIDEAEKRKREEEELALDKMEGFTEVFRRVALPSPAADAGNGA